MTTELSDQQIRDLLILCRSAKPTANRNIHYFYLNQIGARILDYSLEFYQHEPKADIRRRYVSDAISYAHDDKAVPLAQLALLDRAESVRYWAIGVFAVKGDPKYISLLRQQAVNKPKDSQAVDKAILAIEKQDHSLFISIGHPAEGIATITWDIGVKDPREIYSREEFKKEVELFIEAYSPEVVSDLKRILGSLYASY